MRTTALLLFMITGFIQSAYAASLVLFNESTIANMAQVRTLLLPNSQFLRIESLRTLCSIGPAGSVRAYNLETKKCDSTPYHSYANFSLQDLSLLLQGSTLTGQPISDALDAQYFVWFNPKTRKACVVGSCQNTFVTSGTASVSINTFSATPSTITSGSSTILSWTSSAATSCLLSDNQGGTNQTVSTTGSVSKSPLVTTIYTLSCQGNNGPAISAITVTVNSDVNIVEFIATPPSIIVGANSTLSWSTLNATTCTLSVNGATPVSVTNNGTQVVAPSITSQYLLSCNGTSGPVTQALNITVIQLVQIDQFIAVPEQIILGQSTNLSWSTQNASNCTLSEAPSGASQSVQTNGSLTLNPVISTDYTLSCNGQNGPVTALATVTVDMPVSINNFIASPAQINLGSSSTLAWSTSNASACTLSINAGSASPVLVNDTLVVSPTQTSTYKLLCQGVNGPAMQTISILVNQNVQIISFTAQPGNLSFAQSSLLKWQVANAMSCTINNEVTGTQVTIDPLSQLGLRVYPGVSTNYILSCNGLNGPVTANTQINVDPGDGLFYGGMEVRPFAL